MSSRCGAAMREPAPTLALVRRDVHRQEVPLHRQRLHSRPPPVGCVPCLHLTCMRGVLTAPCVHGLSPGVVRSTKMNRTIVVRRDYLHYIKKYARCDRGEGMQAHMHGDVGGGGRGTL